MIGNGIYAQMGGSMGCDMNNKKLTRDECFVTTFKKAHSEQTQSRQSVGSNYFGTCFGLVFTES